MSSALETAPEQRHAVEFRVNFADSVDVPPIAEAMEQALNAVLGKFGFKGGVNVYVHTFTVAAPCDPVDATNEKMTNYHLLVEVDRRYGNEVRGIAKCRTAFIASIFGSEAHAKKRVRCSKCYGGESQ